MYSLSIFLKFDGFPNFFNFSSAIDSFFELFLNNSEDLPFKLLVCVSSS